MANVPGQDLDAFMESKEQGRETHAKIARSFVSAVLAIHEHGLVHRDLKPSNIRIRPDHAPVIIDFGLAVETRDGIATSGAGDFIGTVAFAAPETLFGAPHSPASDAYSAALVLVELFTGRPVFSGSVATVVLAKSMQATLCLPSSWPTVVEDLLTALLDPEPSLRPPLAELLRVLDVETPRVVDHADLLTRWGHAKPTQHVQVLGEPGSGKTTLVRTIRGRSRQRRWLSIRADPRERVPFQVLDWLVTECIRTAPSSLALLRESPSLVRMMPVLAKTLGLTELQNGAASAAGELRALLEHHDAGSDLWIDDAHDLDEDSARVLCEVLRLGVSRTRLVLSGDPSGSGGYERLCDLLRQRSTVLHFELAPPAWGERAPRTASVPDGCATAVRRLQVADGILHRSMLDSDARRAKWMVEELRHHGVVRSLRGGRVALTRKVESQLTEMQPSEKCEEAAAWLKELDVLASPEARLVRGTLFLLTHQVDRAWQDFDAYAKHARGIAAFEAECDALRRMCAIREDEAVGLRLARALGEAGRSREAADAYRALASTPQTLLLAGEHYLYAGCVAEGRASLEAVLTRCGARWPRWPMLRSTWTRLRLLTRAIPTSVEAGDTDSRAHLAARALWGAAKGLALIEHGVADCMAIDALHRALSLRDPHLLMQTMGHEAAAEANLGGPLWGARAHRLLDAVSKLTAQSNRPYDKAWLDTCEGTVAYFEGRWRFAAERCERAAVVFESSGVGAYHESWVARTFQLGAMVELGNLDEVERVLQLAAHHARLRGDDVLRDSIRTGGAVLVRLAADQSDIARQEAELALSVRDTGRFTSHHLHYLHALTAIDLYDGRSLDARARLDRHWAALRSSGFLLLDGIGLSLCRLRASCALACQDYASTDVRRFVRRARRSGQKPARAWALAFEGAADVSRGLQGGDEKLRRAVGEFEELGMTLWALSAQRFSDPELADERLAACGVREPSTFARMMLPQDSLALPSRP
jgi:hypothetical protein